jgi:hypothetical protein
VVWFGWCDDGMLFSYVSGVVGVSVCSVCPIRVPIWRAGGRAVWPSCTPASGNSTAE